MNDTARIRFGDGALVMPACSAYDWELVFEQAEFYARRHGKVKLELDRREMLISTVGGQAVQPCGECGKCEGALRFSASSGPSCRNCIRRRIACGRSLS
jgi:hypothetical protein